VGSFKNNINKTMDTPLTNQEVTKKIYEEIKSVLDFEIYNLGVSRDEKNDIDYIFVEANELEVSVDMIIEKFKTFYGLNLEFVDYAATDKHCNFAFEVIYKG